ncbi:tautomerase family protein [Pusillimonas sp. CC-YST705]|uniref:Tautomerase family protein n=1 Tax=Mesopusillimonas faecipullorum TaxID=2755040 RepID=A0ABS8CBJ5_9BURK|nr:tautomerase family protein [Mesopusillimonas faecipullorum]MCB5363358.1 tautomerase family protein [Mesopusillimonas faecipullorum]
MPFVTITVTQPLSPDQKQQLLLASSDAVVDALKAPLPSVRIVLHELPAGHYLNGGKFDTMAVEYEMDMIEGRSEQLKADVMRELSRAANRVLGVSEEEVRVRMTDFPKTDMGLAFGVSVKAAGR